MDIFDIMAADSEFADWAKTFELAMAEQQNGFYESNNSVQQQILKHTQQTPEYSVSPLCLLVYLGGNVFHCATSMNIKP